LSIPVIIFPKEEWKDIKEWLNDNGESSTVRCGDELGKYKKGQIYVSDQDDKYFVTVTDVKRYKKAEDIPTWDEMTKPMKLSIKSAGKDGKWDYITYERVNLQDYENKKMYKKLANRYLMNVGCL
jgi:hypothetical protein